MIQNRNIQSMPQPSAVPYWNMIKDTSREVKEVLLNMLYVSLNEDTREDATPYTMEELIQRADSAYAELESGGGQNGEEFFAENNVRSNELFKMPEEFETLCGSVNKEDVEKARLEDPMLDALMEKYK